MTWSAAAALLTVALTDAGVRVVDPLGAVLTPCVIVDLQSSTDTAPVEASTWSVTVLAGAQLVGARRYELADQVKATLRKATSVTVVDASGGTVDIGDATYWSTVVTATVNLPLC